MPAVWVEPVPVVVSESTGVPLGPPVRMRVRTWSSSSNRAEPRPAARLSDVPLMPVVVIHVSAAPASGVSEYAPLNATLVGSTDW